MSRLRVRIISGYGTRTTVSSPRTCRQSGPRRKGADRLSRSSRVTMGVQFLLCVSEPNGGNVAGADASGRFYLPLFDHCEWGQGLARRKHESRPDSRDQVSDVSRVAKSRWWISVGVCICCVHIGGDRCYWVIETGADAGSRQSRMVNLYTMYCTYLFSRRAARRVREIQLRRGLCGLALRPSTLLNSNQKFMLVTDVSKKYQKC